MGRVPSGRAREGVEDPWARQNAGWVNQDGAELVLGTAEIELPSEREEKQEPVRYVRR